MLFVQKLSVIALVITSAFAAVIPQDKLERAALLKKRVAANQYKRSSIGRRTTASTPQVSQAYCAGYRNLAGVCVEKCDLSLSHVLQKESGGCQCSSGFIQLSPVGPCVAVCLTNFVRDPVTNQCGCNTSNFDLLSSGVCVAKCSTSQDRVNGNCVPKCSGNVIRGSSGSCDTCSSPDTSFLSQIFSAAGILTSANCVSRCSLPFPLYTQNPSGGCIGTLGAACRGNGVTCQSGTTCNSLAGVCSIF